MTVQRFTVPANVPEPARTLSNVLQAVLKVNRREAESLVHDGLVRINNRVATQVHRFVNVDDQLSVDYVPKPAGPTNEKLKSTAGQTPFTILYDDEAIIVVNKAAGLLTVPTPYREPKTLLGLLNKYQDRKRSQARVHCVHRLDRGVSGVLVFAKSVEVAMLLRDQFAARKPARVYACIVAGNMEQKSGRFESYLATDDELNRYSTNDHSKGQLAITHWQVQFSYIDATLLRVELETGRRNQIRVHLAESNHPVLGDPRYERELAKHARWPYKRIALHAESLGFQHPVTNQPLRFQTEWPQEFRSFHKSMRSRNT